MLGLRPYLDPTSECFLTRGNERRPDLRKILPYTSFKAPLCVAFSVSTVRERELAERHAEHVRSLSHAVPYRSIVPNRRKVVQAGFLNYYLRMDAFHTKFSILTTPKFFIFV